MRVSVVLSTFTSERLKSIKNCIQSLKRQTLPPLEIILTLDPNPTLVDFYRSHLGKEIKIEVSQSYGLSNARNAGVKVAKGDIIAFIDDDATAEKDWLDNIVANYSDPNVVGVGGVAKPVWEDRPPLWLPEELYWVIGCSYKGLPQFKAFVRNPIGCNMSFRKEVFNEVGLFLRSIGRFGKTLLSAEESEFSLRVLNIISGSKIVYDPSTIVYHNVPKSRARLRYLLRRSFLEGLSKGIISTVHSNSQQALLTEDAYLKYLIGVTIPAKLKHPYRMQGLCQVFVLLLSVVVIGIGYLFGKLRR